MTHERLILGSASPRRRQLLEELGIALEVCPADIDESPIAGESPAEYVQRMAVEKLAKAKAGTPAGRAWLTADTVVVIEGEIFGKPSGDQHALEMLSRLVGRTHQVLTSYALAVRSRPFPGERKVQRVVVTDVTMRPATPAELERYVQTGEPRDKAGAYAIQGRGGFLIESIHGSYTNVVGLPICPLVTDLVELGVLAQYP